MKGGSFQPSDNQKTQILKEMSTHFESDLHTVLVTKEDIFCYI